MLKILDIFFVFGSEDTVSKVFCVLKQIYIYIIYTYIEIMYFYKIAPGLKTETISQTLKPPVKTKEQTILGSNNKSGIEETIPENFKSEMQKILPDPKLIKLINAHETIRQAGTSIPTIMDIDKAVFEEFTKEQEQEQ
jgi:hypothetical protein